MENDNDPQDTMFVTLENDVSKVQIGQSLRSWDGFNLSDKEMSEESSAFNERIFTESSTVKVEVTSHSG